jgi:hypothetical protein
VNSLDSLQEVQLRAKLRILQQEHRDLDDSINALEASPKIDQLH